MHRLLKRQLKSYFGKDFDTNNLSADLQKFIEFTDQSYNEYDKEINFLKRTLEINSEELTQANKLIQHENLEVLSLLQQYKNAIDTSLIVSKTNLKGIITYVNDKFCQISGYTKEELIGKNHNIVRHPDLLDAVYTDLWHTIKAKKIWRGFFPNKAKNGETYYVNATIFPILNSQNEVIEYMAIREDVTKNILLQKKSEYLNNRTTQIMNSQESIIVISNQEEGVIDVNKKFFTLTGFKDLNDFKQSYFCICELFINQEGYLSNSKDIYWGDIILADTKKLHKAIIKDSNENKVIFSVVAKTIVLDDKEYLLSTFSNITELENMRVKAEVAERSKSEFLANMSHEIRTPMNGISGFLQLLETTNLTQQQQKYLDITQSSVKSLLKIINDILDFSKIDSGKMESETIQINPFIELEKAFIAFLPDARKKDISYQIYLDPNLEECILLDELHIRQVMQNLINNAIKFTPENGTIIAQVKVIKKYEEYDLLRFSVKDSGIGIERKNQEKIMSAFSQADSSTTRKFGGTGLGLSISSSLVKLMGGQLLLKSEIDKGSLFYFDLEIKKCSKNKKLEEHLDGKFLCLVDNNSKQIKNIKQHLNHFQITFQIIKSTQVEMFFKNNNICHLLITTDEDIAKDYCKNIEVILVSKTDKLKQYHQNLEVISIYEDCPSLLYNKLLTKKFILTDTFAHNYTKDFKLNILIAEDYETNQILLEEHLLKYQNINFQFVQNGKEAVEMLQLNQNFDVVFMDINMPILDGISATKQIREFNQNIPIVALTANALEGDKEKFLSSGMNDYISKPINFDELERVLEKYSQNTPGVHCYSLKFNDILKALDKTEQTIGLPKDSIMKLLKSYIENSQSLLLTLQEGIDTKDMETITRACHNLKSSSLTFNFDKIGQMAANGEKNTEIFTQDEYQKLLESFTLHFQVLKEYLNSLKN